MKYKAPQVAPGSAAVICMLCNTQVRIQDFCKGGGLNFADTAHSESHQRGN